ncbi:MAG: DUF2461 domain-containing protein [Pseudomonadota bacterium]
MTDLPKLITDARRFFTALEADNSKAWFQEHKSTYDADLKAPAKALLDTMSAPLEEMCGDPVKSKLYRPHRDVRFSKDKTPYNTHLHMLWGTEPGGPFAPGYFFGVSPSYVTVGVGQMDFGKDGIAAWRQMVDLDGARLAEMLKGLRASGHRVSAPGLKRVPSPFDKDHPHGELLRHKGMTIWSDADETLTVDGLRARFEVLTPFVRALTGWT